MPPATSDSAALERLPSDIRVHVVGAGPVGLLLTALLQSLEGVSVILYEKRREYTRTRMVTLAPYLVADSVESYGADAIDGDSVGAIFDPPELEQGIAFRQSMPSDLSAMLKSWALGFCPLNSIERSISDLIDARGPNGVQRHGAVVTVEDAMAMLQPGDVLIDSTGSRSLLRDHLVPGSGAEGEDANTLKVRLEYVIVITFLYGQKYDCNEYCKYAKNIENPHYKFIPMTSGYRWTCTARATRPVGRCSPPGRATILSPLHRYSSPATRPSARRTFSRFRLASSAQCSLPG
jgi:flavin-dependent dehydrogenase